MYIRYVHNFITRVKGSINSGYVLEVTGSLILYIKKTFLNGMPEKKTRKNYIHIYYIHKEKPEEREKAIILCTKKTTVVILYKSLG